MTVRWRDGSSKRTERDRTLPTLLKATGELASAIGSAPRSVVLVLDDVEALRSSRSRSVLRALAVGLSSGAVLALASRTAPALPLGRLRAAHALVELGVRDLAMSDAEASHLLRASGPALGDARRERLLRLAEGWPAGLSLCVRSLHDETDRASALEPFAGDHRALVQYVSEEVLASATPSARDFLVRASIFEALSPDACDAVLERTDSGSVLSEIADSNLMLTPLNRPHGSYRCHSLLRAALRAELARLAPGSVRALNRRAIEWFLARGDSERAVEHAIAAGDPQVAGEVIWSHCRAHFTSGREATVKRWLERFDEEQIARSPELSLCAAHSQLAAGDVGAAEHWARVVAGELERSPAGKKGRSLAAGIAIVEAAASRHGLERMAKDAGRASACEREGSPWRGLCALLLGVAEHLAGAREEARASLEDGARRNARRAPGVETLCLAQLALMAFEDGDQGSAAELAERAGALVEKCKLADRPTSALVFAVAALTAAHAGHADEAKHRLGRGVNLLGALGEFMPWYEVETRVVLARASVRLADLPLARTLLSQASRVARRMPDATVFHTWLDGVWAEIDDVGVAALNGACALTTAELRILRFLPTHLSFREIGTHLHVSTNTVKSQAHAVYGKLDVASRSDAVSRASALGLIEAGVT